MKIFSSQIAVLLCILSLVLFPQSCRTKTESSASIEPLQKMMTSSSEFAIDLYKELVSSARGENLFLSPSSIHLALAMTWNGSARNTRISMTQALRLPDLQDKDINAADSVIIASTVKGTEKVELDIANSLWARKGIKFKKSFIERNKRFYGAEIRELDFVLPDCASIINNWVSQKTRGKIAKIVDRVDSDSILFLINAIYFKGAWMEAFDVSATEETTFHSPSGDKKVRMMNRSGKFSYFRGEGFQAARLPYGNGKIAMYIFLPDEGSNLDEFHNRLSAQKWNEWMASFSEKQGHLGLPRFKMEYRVELKKHLSNLGMAVAFDPSKADFSEMLDAPRGTNAYIYDVIHKSFCEVNEEGTEAAAATSVEMRLTSAMEPMDRFEMICDRPFFFAIADDETGLVLFMGSLVDPS